MRKANFMPRAALALAAAFAMSCSSDDEEELYCHNYIFSGQVCSNKIDGKNVIDAKDCRSMGGKVQEEKILWGLGCSEDKQIACKIGSYCVSGARYSSCKANGGSMIASCSGYGGGGVVVCNRGTSCGIESLTSCVLGEHVKVSSCAGYLYCKYPSGTLCQYIKATSCPGTQISVQASACSW